MTQKGLIYNFVAKGAVVLAEHTNVSTVAVQCLQKFPSGSSKYTYSCDGYTFNFLRDTGFVICNLIMLLNLVLSCLVRCGIRLQIGSANLSLCRHSVCLWCNQQWEDSYNAYKLFFCH
ncbi:hypothetical protein L2E82_37652 [Cichorium intybus]|uniref:Uncharacterized protein n=1 Tax=Cichorium intybus TaxID=13427 RepID=A0ACB9AEA7_CICIN|nr:hypothetical protein L2E82_37652 [Cichorium intybus]